MISIKYVDLDPNNSTASDRIVKTSLSLILIVLVFSMAPTYSYFSFIKSAMAAGVLTGVNVVPSSNLVNMRSDYNIFFTTASAGTIKTIEMNFGSDFNIDSATRLIERSGIGSGTLSVSGSVLNYTVSSPEVIPAGTPIRLEIGRIIPNSVGDNLKLTITTKRTSGQIIDGPSQSKGFPIYDIGTNSLADKSITGNDVSPSFMIRKTLDDDNAGHAHGWNPDGSTKSFAIFDSDIVGASDSEFIDVMIRYANLAYCTASPGDTGLFVVHCDNAPVDSAVLDYVITKLPANVVTSTDVSALESSALSSALSKDVTTSQDMASFAGHDDSASEFP
jgi:hypothetical protein